MKDEKKLNVIFSKNGNGYITTKLSISHKWFTELGVDINNREVIATLEDDKIIIKKK